MIIRDGTNALLEPTCRDGFVLIHSYALIWLAGDL